jgi:predicted transcriptional regulator
MRSGSKRRESRLVSKFEDGRFTAGTQASRDQRYPSQAHPEKAYGLRATTAGIEAKERYHTVVNIVSIDDLEALRARIDQALAELDRGEFVDGEEFMQRMLDDLDVEEANREGG